MRFIAMWLLVISAMAVFLGVAFLLAIGPPWVFVVVLSLGVSAFIAFMICNDFPQREEVEKELKNEKGESEVTS